ncbi:MAG: type II secretion system protein [Lachnospiraceae bacterium]|nr:type II secretion system protein [Lachnospiraceae bacterium]
MRERVWKDNKGFTLIEVVITTVVLATISVPLLAYFSDSMRHSARTKEQQNAVVAAQDAVEELKVAGYSLDADKVAEPSAAPNYSWVLPSPMPTGSGVTYEMYKKYTINGKSYNVVANVTPKSSVSGVYNSSSGAYDKDLDFSEAKLPEMDGGKDIISAENKAYLTMAANHFNRLYTTYCSNSGGAVVKDATKVNNATIAAHLKRKIDVYIEQAPTADNVKVSVTYNYTYVKDASDEYPQAILDANPNPHPESVVSKSVNKNKFEGIFIFYTPNTNADEIYISASNPASVLGISDLKLYLIAESSVSQSNATPADTSDPKIVVRSMSYQMKADCDSNLTSVITEVYTNLTNDGMDELASGSNLYSYAKKDASGKYTLITKQDFNRLADIIIKVYRDTGGSYPFSDADKLVEVDGNKVQQK